MPVTGTTVIRRRLGKRLKALRKQSGMTEVQILDTRIMSKAHLYRIESGTIAVNVKDVWALCRIYDADKQTTDQLAKWAIGSADQNWWEDYSDVMPEKFGVYVDLEAAAAAIRTYDPARVHGLLQTAAYARAIERATGVGPKRGEDAIERVVSLRMERQKAVLSRTPPGVVTAVVDEASLARQVGGRSVMAEQTARLRELAQLDHVDIRILPFSAGANAAMLGAFTMMDFDDQDDPPCAYVESYTGGQVIEKAEQLEHFREVFGSIYEQSAPVEEHDTS